MVRELSDCTGLKETLTARPPRTLRMIFAVLVALLGSGAVWSATSKVDLVVAGPGRIRPIT